MEYTNERRTVRKKRKKVIKRKRKKSKYCITLSLTFLFLISQISIMNIIHKNKQISVLENRTLQQMPKFSMSSFFEGDFSSKFENYISDQFPGRDFWIKLKAKTEIMVGENKINNVYLGEDNYLIEDFKKNDNSILTEKINNINNFANKNNGLNVSFMLVPTASEILKDKLPKYAPVNSQIEYINNVKKNLTANINFIDVVDDFKEHKNEDLYYKTDHHWTTKGAYIAYVHMCKQLGIKYLTEDKFDVEDVTNDFYGSLYYKMGTGIGKPDTIKIYAPKYENNIVVNYVNEEKKVASLYNNSKLDGKEKYEVFTDGNHPLINIRTDGDYKKKLLVIKDSYANSFIPFLTTHYGEIDVVDLRYYVDNLDYLIENDGITDVLFLFNVNTFDEDNSILNISE